MYSLDKFYVCFLDSALPVVDTALRVCAVIIIIIIATTMVLSL